VKFYSFHTGKMFTLAIILSNHREMRFLLTCTIRLLDYFSTLKFGSSSALFVDTCKIICFSVTFFGMKGPRYNFFNSTHDLLLFCTFNFPLFFLMNTICF
jgi:hypothetical protein